MRSRGPTKRCITLPGVNKPRGRGLARGSPLRLRLLLRLCISSAMPPPRSLSSTSVATTIFFPFLLSLSLALAPSRSSRGIVRRPQTTLSHSFSFSLLSSLRSVGHPQIIFSRENSSGRSAAAAAAIFSNLSLHRTAHRFPLPLLITLRGNNARNRTEG